MLYTPNYNLNLPEGTDIVNPLVQDNPNYTAIDTALYNNKLRVVGTATHVKVGASHAITLGDSDINQFKFVATGDYATGDTFTVDGVSVTPRIADGSTIPNGAFKINSTVLCILDGTLLNLINIDGTPTVDPDDIILSNGVSVEDAIIRGSASVTANGVKTHGELLEDLYNNELDMSKVTPFSVFVRTEPNGTKYVFNMIQMASNRLVFSRIGGTGTRTTATTLYVATSSSAYDVIIGNTPVEDTNTQLDAGTVLEIWY